MVAQRNEEGLGQSAVDLSVLGERAGYCCHCPLASLPDKIGNDLCQSIVNISSATTLQQAHLHPTQMDLLPNFSSAKIDFRQDMAGQSTF